MTPQSSPTPPDDAATARGLRHRTDSGRPVVIAHRGASGYRPEHTAEAYLLAVSLGADAVEPDVVPTADGVLVVRHENELSGTTDVALHPELTGRRTTKEVDGRLRSGWFTEDFTWAELSGLRARERLPGLRPESARLDDRYPLLRLADLLPLAASALEEARRPLRIVLEVKSPTYFDSLGLPLAELLERELEVAGLAPSTDWLSVESFEKSFLEAIAARGLAAGRVYLTDASGAAYDLVARDGAGATTYAEELTTDGLAALAARTCGSEGPSAGAEPLLDGVAVNKLLLVDDVPAGTRLVREAHAVGLDVLCFTLRPENPFLSARHRVPAPARVGRWREEFTDILSTGVDGVFADHPDLALLARDEPTAATAGTGRGDGFASG